MLMVLNLLIHSAYHSIISTNQHYDYNITSIPCQAVFCFLLVFAYNTPFFDSILPKNHNISPFTHTVCMHRNPLTFLLLFCIAPLSLTYNCAKANVEPPFSPPSNQQITDNFTTDFSSSVPHTEQEDSTPTHQNSLFWDTSDVDISHIAPTRKLIAFTFDDAPAQTLENIFAIYADHNERNPDCLASATIFFNSCRFDKQTPHLLATCLALGMELGNHTHAHYDLTTLKEADLRKEIELTDNALCAIDGKKQHLLRAPFGKINELVKSVAAAPIIDWTIDTLDWSGVSSEAVYQAVFTQRFDGAIVLMHDGYKNTVDALKRLLPDLQADGYQIVSVSQLAKAHRCTMRNGSAYIRLRPQK